MKKILVSILLLSCFLLTGCEKTKKTENQIDERFISSGDFLYQIVEINDEGIQIVEGSENKNCVERFARIRGLSEEGKKKEILIVPKTIDGLEVKEIAAYIDLDSEALRRLYIPFPITKWGYGSGKIKNAPNLEAFIIMSHKIGDNKNSGYTVSSYNKTPEDIYQKIIHTSNRYANVSFMYNYEDAPNYGYYWIDSYYSKRLITYVPNDPVRDGYVFAGWYKEAECINEWDFDVDKLPEQIFIEGISITPIYQETILYAKWVKSE